MRVLRLPVLGFAAGGLLVGGGVLGGWEVPSALGACLMCGTVLGLAVRV